jgi:hypothetical protein
VYFTQKKLLFETNEESNGLYKLTLNVFNKRGYIMSLILVPIAEGKLESWRQWANELQNGKSGEFSEFNSRYGLTRHTAWLAETPNGPVVAALHEGPGAEKFMSELAKSNKDFDVWFKQKLSEVHNLDLSKPLPGSPPKLVIDSH